MLLDGGFHAHSRSPKLEVTYENGEGMAKHYVLAYANYAMGARNGSREATAHRNAVDVRLAPAQFADGQAPAAECEPDKPMPARTIAGALEFDFTLPAKEAGVGCARAG